MSSLWALLLGLVQGLTEFLPVSSSGHLVLAESLLGYQNPGVLVEAVVHLATVLVTLVYFRQRFVTLALGFWRDAAARRLVLMLLVAFVITSVIGLALERWIAAAFETPPVVAGMLLLTAAVLLSARLAPGGGGDDIFQVSWKTALLVGAAQGLAVFPGLSRSGTTIVAGLWGGLGRTAAAEFSFLLAVPTVLAASLLGLWREPDLGAVAAGPLLLAGVVSFASGLLVVHWFMRWLRRGRLEWFAVYCAVIGGGYLLLWQLGWL
ncbi:MAG TPA: undecaprenyl-diphosphate phosphatase [Dehalococcoidia bacterium]|nr:undecaprenyl-diphosphate phosphatase [Dehalococcoidia bacterium]